MAVCPHCKKEVCLDPIRKDSALLVQKEVVGKVKKEIMYSCPHCQCVLGFAFFMGGMLTGRP